MSHPFEVKGEVTLDATRDEVWEAIATGPGIDTWLMGRNGVEPREGGTTRMTMGDFAQQGTVTAWDPGNRFAFRGAEGPDGSIHAFEYLIEGREEARCSDSCTAASWATTGRPSTRPCRRAGPCTWTSWPSTSLTSAAGGRRRSPQWCPKDDEGDVMQRLREGLGLSGTPAAGDRVRMYRFIRGYAGRAVLGHHLFAEGVDETATEQAWQDWLTKLFA